LSGANGGNGGDATATATGTATTVNALTISASSAGGLPGNGAAPGNTGNATTTATGTGDTGFVSVTGAAYSSGGNGGNGRNATAIVSGTGNSSVTTSAQANAYTFGTALARATSTAFGGNARGANSYANSSGGIINALNLYAYDTLISGSNGTDIAESRASVAGSAPAATLADTRQAALFATGSPLNADALSVLSGNPNASSHFQVGGASVMFGLMTLSSGYSSNSTGGVPSTVGDSVSFQIDSSSFANRNVKLALLNPHSTGNGFSQLNFSISSPGGTISQSFTTLASALAFCTDNVLSLGAQGTGFITITITMTVTTSAPGDSFRAQMLLGTGPLFLSRAVSRKTHISAGDLDILLPLSGPLGIECRNSSGNHTLVFTFTNNPASGTAAVTSGSGSVLGNPTFSGNAMTVQLTGVTNAQRISVTLSNVTDEFGEVLPNIALIIGRLQGDTNSDGFVNTGDALQTRNRSGQPTTVTNFRSDINTDGVVNSGDVLIVRNRSGTFLP